MNIKNFKKFAKKPCNFQLLSFFEKMLDTEFANIYTNKACE